MRWQCLRMQLFVRRCQKHKWYSFSSPAHPWNIFQNRNDVIKNNQRQISSPQWKSGHENHENGCRHMHAHLQLHACSPATRMHVLQPTCIIEELSEVHCTQKTPSPPQRNIIIDDEDDKGNDNDGDDGRLTRGDPAICSHLWCGDKLPHTNDQNDKFCANTN